MARVCDFCGKQLLTDRTNATERGYSMALYPLFERVDEPYKYDICQECLTKLLKENKE